jgi:DMSO reductase family type II enzyme molybdopterin subunit
MTDTTAPRTETTGSSPTELSYSRRWSWDKVTWGTHCLNCLATCPYRVFVRDGKVVFEEQGGNIPVVESGVPDLNPLGCQKGSSWSQQLDSPDRILHPMRRVGERGSGEWEEISWDEALTEIAEAVVEAIDIEGPESVVFEETVEGGLLTQAPFLRFAGLLGAITLDANGLVNDFPVGQHMTFGKFSSASSVDDTFHTEVLMLWHSNPGYTWIPYHHYITEARYRGAKVIAIAPDVNAASVASDTFVPIQPGTDAALALSMCKVIVDEGLLDEGFVQSQTDLPLLVDNKTGRFLRESEVTGDGLEDQFYHWTDEGLTLASRASLFVEGVEPALRGTWSTTLSDGTEVELTTVWEMLLTRLEDYTPEAASEMCGVNPEVIRTLARDVAGGRTKILEGFNTPKYYHGDLMERSMVLLLALTGNWGKPGTGIQGLALAGFDGYLMFSMKSGSGVDETARILDGLDSAMDTLRERDSDSSDEILGNQLLQMAVVAGSSTPPVFFNNYHAGYEESWNKAEWSDPYMTKSFGEYLTEAVQRGWWGGLNRPGRGTDPQVLFVVGTNPLRRSRGGRSTLLENLWPKLEKIVAVDFRMSTTALHADIVLPAAMHYERTNLQYAITHTFRLAFSDEAVPPAGEARTEWAIFRDLSAKVSEVAEREGLDEYLDGRRQTRRLDDLVDRFTSNGAFETEEAIIDEWVRDSVEADTLPPGTSIDTLREDGSVRFTGLGVFAPGLSVAGDVERDKVLTSYTWHVEKGTPFPTLTRRAQFYLDHPWFIEADEALPRHKDPPKQGGDYPFLVTSGHSRWTVHSISMGNKPMLQTHRGRPVVVLNIDDCAQRGIADGDMVRVWNDHGSYEAMARCVGRVRPGQLIMYNGFEPHMFPGWKGANEVEPGMVKWLHLVSRYGHLRYIPFGWQPIPSDRAVFVDIERLGPAVDADGCNHDTSSTNDEEG